MTQREKLIERLRARPSRARFADVRRLLELDGWTLKRTRGSHMVFTKPGKRTLPVPTHSGVVNRVYIDLVLAHIED